MGYTSFIQAKDRVTNPRLDNSSSILYASDNFFTLGTTFYTNESKSVLAPAGNYVIPTHYKTYYATIGSNGRFTTQPLELMTGSFDTNWTDCTGYSGSARMDLTASYWDGTENISWMGMKLSLSQSADGRIYLTDDYWDTTTARFRESVGQGFKGYHIENGPLHSAGGGGLAQSAGFFNISQSLKSVDITDMKGYDLRVLNGEYHTGSNKAFQYYDTPNYNWGYAEGSIVQGVVHLAADPDRVVTTGSLTYTFRPDYWYAPEDYEAPTYVRRMPDIPRIKDKWGKDKLFVDMAYPLFDRVPVSNGTAPYDKNVDWRISTIAGKGITQRARRTNKKIYNLNDYWSTEDDFDYAHGGVGKFYFGGDFPIRGAMGVARPDIGTRWPDGQEIPAMIRSLIVDNETWQYGSYGGFAYTNVNPYHWTYQINSGTGYQSSGPANQLISYLGKGGGYDNPVSLYMFDHIQEDYEVYNGNQDYYVAQSLKACYDSVVQYGIDTAQLTSKSDFVEWSIYAMGIYKAEKFGQEGQGWLYFTTGSNVNENYEVFKFYDEYFISSSKTADQTVGNNLYRGFGEYVKYSFITNYVNDASNPWYIYGLVHNYDISRKLINEIYNEATASTMQCPGYFWRRHEPVAGTDVYYKRTGTSYSGFAPGTGGNPGDRVWVCPSLLQSLGAWCFAYADGLFVWNEGPFGADEDKGADFYWKHQYGWNGEDNSITGNIQAMYGDVSNIDNGGMDWLYAGYLQVAQHKDIIEADTPWVKPHVYWNGEWKTGKYNYPVYLYNRNAPISAYKVSADGTEVLLLTCHGTNNGYTKSTFSLRFPTLNNRVELVNTWGNYTSVIRIKIT
jgi:hypothetical protein